MMKGSQGPCVYITHDINKDGTNWKYQLKLSIQPSRQNKLHFYGNV